MKKITTIILTTFLWTLCVAQNNGDVTSNKKDKSNDRKNFFYLNPFPFLTNTFQINYERFLPNNKIGLLFSGGYTLVDCYEDGKKGGSGEIHLRFYLTDTENKTRRLFYFSPYLKYQYIETISGYYLWDYDKNEYYFIDKHESYVSSYSGGLLIGLKWIFQTQLTFDLYIGGGIQYSDIKGEHRGSSGLGDYYGNYTGPLPKLGIQFGYNF